MKKIFFALVYFFVSSQCRIVSAVEMTKEEAFGFDKTTVISPKLENQTLPESIQTYVNFIMTFFYLIAVMYVIWGGFLILTAGGEEENVKKAKTIMIQGAIGLLIVFLAAAIVNFALTIFFAT